MTLAITRKNLTYFISPPRYVEPKFFSFSLSSYIYKPSYCRSCLVGRLSRYKGSLVANFSTLAKKLLDANRSTPVKVTLNDLRSDPLSSYKLLKARLEKYGVMAPFPEFLEVVLALEKELKKKEVLDFIETSCFAKNQHTLVLIDLAFLQVHFRSYDAKHPLAQNYGQCPYAPSLFAIKKALEFLDNFNRISYQGVPDLYHTERYSYIFPHIFNNQLIYFPVLAGLKLKDFIRLRSVPIGFIGVESQAVFTDGDYNSPLDYFFHDMHHFRRQIGHNKLFQQRTKLSTDKMFNLFNKMIKKVELFICWNEATPKKERMIRQILELLYFELWHEFGFTPDQESIKTAFLCKPPMRFANEYMSDPEFNHKDLETLRLPSFLLKSGFSSFEPGQKNLIINYFFDRSPHFLTTAYNKAINGFYDHYWDRSADLPPLEQRTTELFFMAAKRLLAIHGLSKRVSDETLKDLLILKGPLEKYLNEKLIIPTKL